MANTKDIGNVSEAKVLARLVAEGFTVLCPFGDNARYDLVVEQDGSFVRIQVKTGRARGGVVKFSVCSSQGHRGKDHLPYHGQIDLFAVYCPQNDTIYFVPIGEAGRSLCHLRFEPPKNGQGAGIRLAEHYLDFPKHLG